MTPEDMQKLDMKSEHGAMLEAAETLEALAKIADDPLAYDPVLFDAAYTRAEQLAHSFCGMMMGLRAAEIAETFRRAVKARKACEKYDLVPKAALESQQEQIKQLVDELRAAEAKIAAHASFGPGDIEPPDGTTRRPRVCMCCNAVEGDGREGCQETYPPVHKWAALEAARGQTTTHASFGPGDPFPDPPPTKPLTPWTAESLRRAYCAHVGGPRLAAWDMLGAQTRRMFEALAYVANVRMGIESP